MAHVGVSQNSGTKQNDWFPLGFPANQLPKRAPSTNRRAAHVAGMRFDPTKKKGGAKAGLGGSHSWAARLFLDWTLQIGFGVPFGFPVKPPKKGAPSKKTDPYRRVSIGNPAILFLGLRFGDNNGIPWKDLLSKPTQDVRLSPVELIGP